MKVVRSPRCMVFTTSVFENTEMRTCGRHSQICSTICPLRPSSKIASLPSMEVCLRLWTRSTRFGDWTVFERRRTRARYRTWSGRIPTIEWASASRREALATPSERTSPRSSATRTTSTSSHGHIRCAKRDTCGDTTIASARFSQLPITAIAVAIRLLSWKFMKIWRSLLLNSTLLLVTKSSIL